MDPFSLVAFALGAAIGGVIGNRADDVFCQIMSTVTDRLRCGGPPVNHDLQRAVRKACLQATLVVCEARLKEPGMTASLFGRDLSDEMRWLKLACRALKEELRQLPRTDYVPPSSEAVQRVELLLQPRAAARRVDELRALLKQELLSELKFIGASSSMKPLGLQGVELPPRVVEMVQQGWDDSEPDGIVTHLDWFDLLSAFFVYELKRNQKVANIFQSELLANLSVEGQALTLDLLKAQFEEFGGKIMTRLEQLDAHLAQLRSEQAEGFASVQDRLDEALPLLVCLPDIGAKQQTAIEMLQAILEILKPLPLTKPDYAAYLQRLQQRLDELTARECALFRLADFDPLTDALPLQLAEVKPGSPFRLAMPDGERGAAEEILAKYPHLVIIADGGAGKTTLARRWACALAERALTDTTASVPVYVEMNLYQQGKLLELITASAELNADTLQAELYAGRFALILDGLNEVAADAYTDAVRELRTLLGHDNNNRVLVTTRKHAYKDDLRLPTFAIEPLRKDAIKEFVGARLRSERDAERAETLARQLLADARLRSLAENPMMLTMLTAIVGQADDLPRNRGQLFKAFVDGVFAWEGQSLKAGETCLDRSIRESCLAAIAFHLTEQGKVAAEKLTFGNWIADKLDELRLKKLDWTDVYDELLRNGLLVESGREVRFFHEVWQDYFCACELRKDVENLKSLFRVGWDAEVGMWKAKSFYSSIVLLAGIMDDAGPIVKQALEENEWGYAFDCFAVAEFVNPDVEQELFGVLPDRWGMIRPQTRAIVEQFGRPPEEMNLEDDTDCLMFPVCEPWPEKVTRLLGLLLLRSQHHNVKTQAAYSLGIAGGEWAINPLVEALRQIPGGEWPAELIIRSLAWLHLRGVRNTLPTLLDVLPMQPITTQLQDEVIDSLLRAARDEVEIRRKVMGVIYEIFNAYADSVPVIESFDYIVRAKDRLWQELESLAKGNDLGLAEAARSVLRSVHEYLGDI